jgi:hypothetical protein
MWEISISWSASAIILGSNFGPILVAVHVAIPLILVDINRFVLVSGTSSGPTMRRSILVTQFSFPSGEVYCSW